MRVLFFNEGNLGTYILGQAQVEAAFRAHTASVADVEARFAGPPPLGRLANAAVGWTTPLLTRTRLDVRTARWHTVMPLRARRALRGELRGWRPDALHVHSHSIALAMGPIMREIPTALSVDVTIGDWSAMPAWRRDGRFTAAELAPIRAAERRRFDQAGVVLAWTDWARRAVLAAAPGARVVEHHPGLDLTHFTPAPRAPRDRPRLLFIGGRFAEKGGEHLLEALGDDLGRTVELDLVTPADVPARPGLRVHRLGPLDPELLELRRQADLLVLPSLGDAAPWAVVEAMACGVPAVASTVGGIPDLLGHGEAGVLVPPGDPRALRAAIDALLSDPERLRALGAAARRRCEERYDAARQTASLVSLLRSLTG